MKQEIFNLALGHLAEYKPPRAVSLALKEYGVREGDPKRSELFGEVSRMVREHRKREKTESAEVERAKKAEQMRDAYAAERRHPRDSYE